MRLSSVWCIGSAVARNTFNRHTYAVCPNKNTAAACEVLCLTRRQNAAQVYGGGVWASLALMCASAVCGSITDLAFDLEGYLWQLVNCLFTASYSLYLRGVMDRVVSLTVNKTRLDEFSMVFYNNVLSLPLIGMLMWWYGELDTVMYDPALRNPMFIMAACSSALVAFGISFASLWFLSTTTATSYSLVGSLNKIPVALIGLVAFDVPWNLENLASILVGLIAGIVFVKAKSVPINK